MGLYSYDQSFREKGYRVVAGIDEAGRGPIAGPVVAAAVVLPANVRIEGLRDSKKVPEKQRRSLFWEVLCLCSDIGIGIAEHDEIDRINVLRATRAAMVRALEDLNSKPDMLVIDAVALPSLRIEQVSPVRAESKSAAVAAASIAAKYVRDMIMLRYDEIYPSYNFGRHKGYCTEEHVRNVKLYGPSPIHRKSFRKVLPPSLLF